MKAHLIKGKDLAAKQIQQVKAAFVYRWLAIGPDLYYPTESDWINDHAFYFRKDGKLAAIPKYCELVYQAD